MPHFLLAPLLPNIIHTFGYFLIISKYIFVKNNFFVLIFLFFEVLILISTAKDFYPKTNSESIKGVISSLLLHNFGTIGCLSYKMNQGRLVHFVFAGNLLLFKALHWLGHFFEKNISLVSKIVFSDK